MSIFTAGADGGDAKGIFACPDECGDTTAFTTLTFYRATHSQDNVGQMILSYTSNVCVRGSLQPESDGYPRYLQGTLQEINYKFIVLGNAPVVVGDRTTVSNHSLEAKKVDHWGTFQTEIGLTYVR
jgi:hypothetical protein